MLFDLLIKNANILTQNDAQPNATSVAVSGDKFFAVTENSASLKAKTTVDAAGATMIPGFNDAHAHSVWFGHTLLEVNLKDCADLDDLYQRIERAAADLDAQEWLICSGFNQMDTGGKYPDKNTLDKVSGARPVWIKHTSGHAAVVSAKAMQILGITGREIFDGGLVVTDASGQPTGLLEESAMKLVQDFHLPASDEKIVAALAKASNVYASEGLTSVSDAGIGGGWIGHSASELGAYQRAFEENKLLTRMQPMLVSDVLQNVANGDDKFFGLPGGIRSGFGNEFLQLGPVKVFLDGSILGNTAKMSAGYHNCPANHGYFQGDVENLKATTLEAARAGWALAMHAVGDEAIDLAIEILTQLETEKVVPPLPHRLEHGGFVTDKQLQQLAKLNVPIVAQPFFLRVYGDGFREYIGDQRTHGSFRMKSLLDVGLTLAGSSDRPVAEGAPLKVIQAAVMRQTEQGFIYGPAERLSIAEALKAYTLGSAQATGAAQTTNKTVAKGMIRDGYLADFTLLERNPLTTPVDEISDIKVLGTVLGGQKTFDATGSLNDLPKSVGSKAD